MTAKTSDTLPIFDAKPTKMESTGEWILSGTWEGNVGSSIGIDPGVNYGITEIQDEVVTIGWGKFESDKRPGWNGMFAFEHIMHTTPRQKWPAVVEGAAYNKIYKQVQLEEIRFGFFMGLWKLGYNVAILPPPTIRKSAFGNGRTQAGDLYPTMNQNAADSLGCAIAALHMFDKEDE